MNDRNDHSRDRKQTVLFIQLHKDVCHKENIIIALWNAHNMTWKHFILNILLHIMGLCNGWVGVWGVWGVCVCGGGVGGGVCVCGGGWWWWGGGVGGGGVGGGGGVAVEQTVKFHMI